MTKEIFLILNLVIAFYNVGTIWAHEIDIFPSWRLIDAKCFHKVQLVHWKKIPYWIFTTWALSLVGIVTLFWYHPEKIPLWEIWFAFALLFLTFFLTAIFWAVLQAKLSKDELGNASPYLDKIIKTHWIRTLLMNAYGLMLLYMTIQTLS